LSFGGTAFAIDPRDLAFVPVDPANAKNGDCISGISAGNFGGATQWLVRALFIICFGKVVVDVIVIVSLARPF
jgi:hypothetical protein